MSLLAKTTGLPEGVDATAPELLPIYTKHAEIFLKAGGVLTLADWAELNDLERAAFAGAAKHRFVEAELLKRQTPINLLARLDPAGAEALALQAAVRDRQEATRGA